MSSFKKKLTPVHQEFVNKYCYSQMRNPKGKYAKIIFCEDENLAIVIPASIYYGHKEEYSDERDFPDGWGCVNMENQVIVPFDYKMVYDFGHFLIAKYCGLYHKVLYTKSGKELYELSFVKHTTHKSYIKLYDYKDSSKFRICIRKMAVTKGLFEDILVFENGFVYLKNDERKVGAILFSKIKLPFEYRAITTPQNGFLLGIKQSHASKTNSPKYDCLLIKIESQIEKEKSIRPTEVTLFTSKEWDDVLTYFEDKEQFKKEVNSIVCNNQQVHFNADTLNFFPTCIGLPQYPTDDEVEEKDYFDPWSRENYSQEEAIYDAFDGEMDAMWNID